MKKLTPRDKYLRKRFGITQAEYDKALEKQGGVCKICGNPPGTKSLHVDHDHTIERWKISTKKFTLGRWKAWPTEGDLKSVLGFSCEAETKPEARKQVKDHLRRISVRGILCWKCNTALQKFQDDPVKMRKASEYLEQYYGWIAGNLERTGFEE